MSHLLQRFRRGCLALHRDEEGAAMLFACLTFLALALSIMFVFQVGLVSTSRIQMQNTADQAAYSGALVEANSLNAIGQLNDGMAYLHYTLLRYVVDSTVVRTLESYKHHAQYARSQPGRFLAVGQGDYTIQLSLTGDPTNGLKPGNSYGPGAESTDAPDWVLLGDEGEWIARRDHVEQFKDLIRDGKQWLKDLQEAERFIVQVTPRLVREEAIATALNNGATHVNVSGDLQEAWKVGTTAEDGWEEMRGTGGASGGDALTQNMWARYTERTLEVDGEARPFPTWFDAKNGKTQSAPGYYQIRLCWNINDWGHSRRPDFHSMLGFPLDAPNGHWHCRHAHMVQADGTFTVVISHGGIESGRELPCESNGFGGGHPGDDTPLHSLSVEGLGQMHHAVVPCPTCAGQRNGPGTLYSDVKKTWRDANPKDGMDLGVGGDFPRPIMPRGSLLRSGVTVAAWREDPGLGGFFPASPWGIMGIASAQVGLMNDAEQVLLLRALADKQATYGNDGANTQTIPVADASNPRSFFYSRTAQRGMRFGARLVPIAGGAGDLTPWHPNLEKDGLDKMIGPSPTGWVDRTRTSGPDTTPQLDGLADFLRVDSKEKLRRTMWH